MTARRLLATTLCASVAALVAVFATGAAAPQGPRARAEGVSVPRENDRTLKLDLIDRLKASPQTVILGSSRGRRAAPSYLRKLTGRTGFNAAVRSGTAADAWVMTRYLADCFPGKKRRYLWFVDVGVATNGINSDLAADPRSRRYLGSSASAGSSAEGPRPTCGPGDHRSSSVYKPDGSLGRTATHLPENGNRLAAEAAKLVASVRAHPRALSGRLDPKRYVYFERALAFMNGQGARPVIVLNPIYPTVLAALRKVGFPARQTSRRYLAGLHRRYDFVVVDGEDIRRWGGSPRDFANPTHINTVNMRRLLRYVVAHSSGALR